MYSYPTLIKESDKNMNLVEAVERAMFDKRIKTVAHLTRLTGVSEHKISGLLNGHKTMKLADLDVLFDVLDIEIKYIMKGDKIGGA